MTYVLVIGQFLLRWCHHWKQFIPRHVEKLYSPQFNNNENSILPLDGAPVHFVHTARDWIWISQVDGLAEENHLRGTLIRLILRLSGYLKDQGYGQRVHAGWTQKHGSLQQLQVLQRTCYIASGKGRTGWDACRVRDGALCEVFRAYPLFCLFAQKLFQLMNKTVHTAPS